MAASEKPETWRLAPPASEPAPKTANPFSFVGHSRFAAISGLFFINIQGSEKSCTMSIYVSFLFSKILGYPSNLVLPFSNPRAVKFLISDLISGCCNQRQLVAFYANIVCFHQHSRFSMPSLFSTRWTISNALVSSVWL